MPPCASTAPGWARWPSTRVTEATARAPPTTSASASRRASGVSLPSATVTWGPSGVGGWVHRAKPSPAPGRVEEHRGCSSDPGLRLLPLVSSVQSEAKTLW